MRITVLLAIVGTLALPETDARIIRDWTYQQMFDKADLVAVAKVISTHDADERSSLAEIEPHVPVIGVTTTMKVLLTLKGPHDRSTFELHHYRFQNSDEILAANSPNLLQLTKSTQVFLVFVSKEHDGRFAPVTGQSDPASFSVVELASAASD